MSFIEKNIYSLTEILQSAIYANKTAKKSGMMQMLDPRTKIISLFTFLIAISFSQNIYFILVIYLLLLIIAFFSKISLKTYLFRVWLFLPFFTGLIILPIAFNVYSPGNAVVILLNIKTPSIYLAITDSGLRASILLLFRIATSVSSSVLVILTTDWIILLKALEKLHIPKIFIAISLMTYRYLFVLLKTAHNMIEGRKSRKLGKSGYVSNTEWTSSVIGYLFGKTQDMSEEVYNAMKSRGYNNNIRLTYDFSFRIYDYIALSVMAITITIMSLVFKNL
jgi:cobalt/nickel transport system permease protein